MHSNDPEPTSFDWNRHEDELADVVQLHPDESVPVDSADAQQTPRWSPRGERRPLLPAWLKSRSDFSEALRWSTGYAGHVTAYHVLRLPKYTGRLLWRFPIGLG